MAKTPITIFALTAVTAGTTTKASPPANGIGAHVDVATVLTAGSTVGMRIKNGTAPGVAGSMTLQQSPDGGTSWFDVYTVGGTTVLNEDTTVTISAPRGIRGLRALCYGHTTNNVSYEAILTTGE